MKIWNKRNKAKTNDPESQRLEAAALWFAELEDQVADPEAFERWRAVPENALAFLRVSGSATWFEDQKHLLNGQSTPSLHPTTSVHRRLLVGAGIAAGATLIGAGSVALLNPSRAMAATGVGQRSSLSLPDGGRLDINTNSRVYWRFDDKVRRIWLDRGEIAVSVVQDMRPMLLTADSRKVLFEKGLFNVRLVGAVLRVTVLEGVCRPDIASGTMGEGRGRTASKGNQIAFHGNEVEQRPLASDDLQAVTAWRNDEIIFRGTALSQATMEYNRYLTRKIVVADPGLAQLQIGGRFSTRDPSDFLAALSSSFQIHVVDSGKDQIELRR